MSTTYLDSVVGSVANICRTAEGKVDHVAAIATLVGAIAVFAGASTDPVAVLGAVIEGLARTQQAYASKLARREAG